ncbi:hypothetical protein THASP1DRAFT_33424 [Thamnocephalis sphaerospora]|uniref:Armadillo-type protein n=1 Tax=Thamnocephalis sphaerospora TaxID=78915 RepID=A0A4P9XHL0_9FUNG|nr:hypothetical protein THASP1DRAFT_33424 [Thamnocephalis sphaerospora]|eukprot:RKP04771.1 hypothetical protein THASP1DRAFT_33424 [Thamnocephalis sphaerospora]
MSANPSRTTPAAHVAAVLEEQVLAQLSVSAAAQESQLDAVGSALATLTGQLRATELADLPAFWTCLERVCTCVHSMHGVESGRQGERLTALAGAALRFIRNLVAGEPRNQQAAVNCGADRLALSVIAKGINDRLATRVAIQTLCNLVTGNAAVRDVLWTHMLADDAETEWHTLSLLARASDSATRTALLVFVLNAIKNDAAAR